MSVLPSMRGLRFSKLMSRRRTVYCCCPHIASFKFDSSGWCSVDFQYSLPAPCAELDHVTASGYRRHTPQHRSVGRPPRQQGRKDFRLKASFLSQRPSRTAYPDKCTVELLPMPQDIPNSLASPSETAMCNISRSNSSSSNRPMQHRGLCTRIRDMLRHPDMRHSPMPMARPQRMVLLQCNSSPMASPQSLFKVSTGFSWHGASSCTIQINIKLLSPAAGTF